MVCLFDGVLILFDRVVWLRIMYLDWISVFNLIVVCVLVVVVFIFEGLLVVLMVSLMISVNMMWKNKVLCKLLKIVEMFGFVFVICLDKIGILIEVSCVFIILV